MEDFLKLLKTQDSKFATFSDSLWPGLLVYTTVYADGGMTFTFKNEATIDGYNRIRLPIISTCQWSGAFSYFFDLNF